MDFDIPDRITYIGGVFGFTAIQVQVSWTLVHTHNHAAVGVQFELDEEGTVHVGIFQAEFCGGGGFPGHQRTARTRFDAPCHKLVTVEDDRHDAHSTGGGHELVTETQHTACLIDEDQLG